MPRGAYIGISTRLGDLDIGSTVKLNVNGTAKEFLVVHQGLPSSLYDSSCNGTWLLMKDIYEKRVWDSSNNNYKNSDIHAYLNGTFLGLFDSDIQSAIKQVKLPYQNGTGSGGSIASGSNGLSTKVFLLGGYEVGWTTSTNQYFPVDGACLSYFSGTSSTDSKRIAYYDGSATFWWLRSPYTHDTLDVWYVYTNGDWNGSDCSYSYGVRPALVLPSTFILNEDREISKGYIGIENIARKIKKAYIGVGGVARPCWARGEVTYYGAVDSLSSGNYTMASVSTDNYVLFANGASYRSVIDMYDRNLLHDSSLTYSEIRSQMAGAKIGSYAILAGGYASYTYSNIVDCYDANLTRTSTTLTTGRYDFAGDSNSELAIFSGGNLYDRASEAYNKNLLHTILAETTAGVNQLASASAGEYVIFAGGYNASQDTSQVYAYNADGVITILANSEALPTRIYMLAGTSIGQYALFAGGFSITSGYVCSANTIAYNKDLVKTYAAQLSVARQTLTGTSVDGYALFAGGVNDGSLLSRIDVYDDNLVKVDNKELPSARQRASGATIGGYALFAGGLITSEEIKNVDVYSVV